MNKTTRSSVFTYALVVGAFVILQLLRMTTGLGSVLEGQLIPICAYVTMALALNLVVGVSGELSLGHAGFMSIGAFLGCAAANGLAELIPFTPVRLGVAMVIGAALAGFFGFLIGIPVLRLNGDYLAIVTLAFGEIIKSVLTNTYLAGDKKGLHFSFLTDKNALEEGGLQLIRGPMGVMNTQRISTFTVGFVRVVITLVVIFNLVNSRTGRAIMAARDNRIAAESVGISVTKYKMIAFVTSAALAGAAAELLDAAEELVDVAGVFAEDHALEHLGVERGGAVAHLAVAADALVGVDADDVVDPVSLGMLMDLADLHVGDAQILGAGAGVLNADVHGFEPSYLYFPLYFTIPSVVFLYKFLTFVKFPSEKGKNRANRPVFAAVWSVCLDERGRAW